MSRVVAKIRKIQGDVGGSPPSNPWMYDYLQDGQLETVATGFATALAALNSVRDRVVAESFASGIIRVVVMADTEGENS